MNDGVDRTPPTVDIRTPIDGTATAATTIAVIAQVGDAMSGVATATCNGRPAQIDRGGTVTCSVPLAPGVNDIVVQAADAAGNSGSAGIRATRTGPSSALLVSPQALSALVGKPRPLQVFDDYGVPQRDVTWRVDNPLLADMSDDGSHMLMPKARGVVTVTAMRGGLSASARVTIFDGESFPTGTLTWAIASVGRFQAFNPPKGPLPPEQIVSVLQTKPGRTPLVISVGGFTGRIAAIETPPIDGSETIVNSLVQSIGGSLFVVESGDGGGSWLVRGGRFPVGSLWRYRSPGGLAHQLVQGSDGAIAIVETGADGFPQALLIDGRNGRVLGRSALPRGQYAALNVACVDRANAVREVPAEIGTPTGHVGALAFEMLRVDDVEDFRQCGAVGGHVRRILEAVFFTTDGWSAQPLRDYMVPAGSLPPKVTMFPIAGDGQNGYLAPWTLGASDGSLQESRVTHITANGRQDYVLPLAGQIYRLGSDLGVMTDGKTVVAFHLMSGEVKWTRVVTAGTVKILPVPGKPEIYLQLPGGTELVDEFGRPVNGAPR